MRFPFFDIEDSLLCIKDSLRIYDGPTVVSRTIASLCGKRSNQVFYSSGNQVVIKFKTDGENNARGFELVWSSELPITTSKPTTTTTTTERATTSKRNVIGRFYLPSTLFDSI